MATSSTNSSDFIAALNRLSQTVDGAKEGLSEPERVAALKTAQKLAQSLEKPRDAIVKMSFSPTHIAVVRTAIDMGIFEALSERNAPMTLDELAAVKNDDPVLTERVLRLFSGIGYVVEDDVRVYSANALTREMSTRLSAATLRYMFDSASKSLALMPEWIRKTKFQNPPEANNGPLQYAEGTKESMWGWLLTERTDLNDDFNTFMEASSGDRGFWVDWFPVEEHLLSGFTGNANDVLLVDMAGGRGQDIKAFQAKFVDTPGRLILQDQEHVLADAQVGDRIEKMPFDLYKPQPVKGAKIYYMKKILHDWSDSQSQEILQHIRDAMKKGYSTLLIEEFVMPEKDAPLLATMWDREMLICCASMERDQSHWTRLLASAGFRVVKFWYPPGDSQSIIEAEIA